MAKPSSSSSSPSPFRFLYQALLLPSNNPKLFSTLFFIYILTHAILYAAFRLSIAPLVLKLTELTKMIPTLDPTSPEFTNLLNTLKSLTKQLLIDEAVYFVFLFVISCFLSIVVYYASSAAYLGDSTLTIKELLNKVKSIIKGPIITQLLVGFFSFIFIVVFVIIVFLLSPLVAINNQKINSLFIIAPLTLLASLLLLYFAVIWSMAVAISVIEPNVYGYSAIQRAGKVLKGKKMQVFLLILALIIASGVLYACNLLGMKFVSGSKMGGLVVGFVSQVVQQMVNLFSMMAVTVLYHECVGSKIEYAKLDTTSIV